MPKKSSLTPFLLAFAYMHENKNQHHSLRPTKEYICKFCGEKFAPESSQKESFCSGEHYQKYYNLGKYKRIYTNLPEELIPLKGGAWIPLEAIGKIP